MGRRLPAMKNLAPAFARIARLSAQREALREKLEGEQKAIRREGTRIAIAVINRAGLVKGETLIQIGRWDFGIYDGTILDFEPTSQEKAWVFRIRLLSVRSNGRPGTKRDYCSVRVRHPGSLADDVKIVGKVMRGKVVRHD